MNIVTLQIELKIKEEKSLVEDVDGDDQNKELKRLQFYGAGPKMAGYDDKKEQKPRGKNIKYDFDPVSVVSRSIVIFHNFSRMNEASNLGFCYR